MAEDSHDDIFLLERSWKSAGIEIPLVYAYDGKEAMELLEATAKSDRSKLPKVVLTDLKMPGATGFEVLKFLRTRECFKGITPLVWSNSSEISDLRRAYDLGARCCLPKPASQHSWKMLVERVVEFYKA